MNDTPAEQAPDEVAEQDVAGSAADEALAAAREEIESLREQWARVAAELDNQRKRAARDIENARQFGIERFARELLAVVDSLEMGIEAGAGSSADSLLEGSRATLRLLLGVLEKFGVRPVDPCGEPFDPQLHEAMSMQPSDTAEPGSVLQVMQKGYTLNGRLLRPARVIVSQDGGGEA